MKQVLIHSAIILHGTIVTFPVYVCSTQLKTSRTCGSESKNDKLVQLSLMLAIVPHLIWHMHKYVTHPPSHTHTSPELNAISFHSRFTRYWLLMTAHTKISYTKREHLHWITFPVLISMNMFVFMISASIQTHTDTLPWADWPKKVVVSSILLDLKRSLMKFFRATIQ